MVKTMEQHRAMAARRGGEGLPGFLDPAQHAPLYLRIRHAIRRAIEQDWLKPNSALPTERELAEAFGASRVTIRKALEGLADEGLLRRRQGAGTFVGEGRIEKSLSRITSFSEDMRARNRVPRSEWVSRSEGAVLPEEALALGVSPGTRVYRFVRVRYADDLPMALESATILASALPSIDAVDASLYDALERHSHRPVRALQRLRAISLDAERARQLELPAGAAALLIERRGFLASGQPVEVTVSHYRGDAYDFLAELGV
jgi:GntR family transcriptional regulator